MGTSEDARTIGAIEVGLYTTNGVGETLDKVNKGELKPQDQTDVAKIDISKKFLKAQYNNSLENGNNEAEYAKQSLINGAEFLMEYKKHPASSLDPVYRETLKALGKAIAKFYGKENVTLEEIELFHRGVKSGEIKLEDLSKHTERLSEIQGMFDIERVRQQREAVQKQINSRLKVDAPIEPELKLRYQQLGFKEASLKVSARNMENTEGIDGLTMFSFEIFSELGNLGKISIKSKSDSAAMSEMAYNFLKLGTEDILKKADEESYYNMKMIVDEFMNAKFNIINEDKGEKAYFNDLNRAYSKFSALMSFKEDIASNDDQALKDYIKESVEEIKKELIEAYTKGKGQGVSLSYEEAKKLVSGLSLNDLRSKNAYQIYKEYKAELDSQLDSDVRWKSDFYDTLIPKLQLKSKESYEEKIERLLKEGYSEADIKNGIINALLKENLSLGEIKERYPQLDRVVSEENREQALQQAKTVDNSVEQEIAKEKQMDDKGFGFGA